MKKIAYILVACLILAAHSTMAGCAEPKQFSDASSPIAVKAGEEFVISLESNPSTGYHWQLSKPLNEAIMVLVDSQFQAPNTKLIGAPGVELWTFKASGKGSTEVAFEYVRSWEKDVPPARNAVFTVLVD